MLKRPKSFYGVVAAVEMSDSASAPPAKVYWVDATREPFPTWLTSVQTDPLSLAMCLDDREPAPADALPGDHPAIAIVRVPRNGLRGARLIRSLKLLSPTIRIIVLAQALGEALTYSLLRAGADGLLDEPVSLQKMRAAIREVEAGGAPLGWAVSRKVVRYFHSAAFVNEAIARLSASEYRILGLLSHGLTDRMLASQVGMSVTKLRFRLKTLYAKLGVYSRAQASFVMKRREGIPDFAMITRCPGARKRRSSRINLMVNNAVVGRTGLLPAATTRCAPNTKRVAQITGSMIEPHGESPITW